MEREKNPILVIIPAFNEEKSIAKVILGITRLPLKADILVIDDGSTDLTAAKAKEAGADLLRLPFNLGYGVALQTGYKYCIKRGYRFAVQLDADGQHDPGHIRDLVAEIENGEADIIIGSRFLGKVPYKTDFLRMSGIRLYSMIVSAVIRQKITDPTSGFQALGPRALRLYCEDNFPSDFPDADILIFSHLAGLKIKEIPVVMRGSPSHKRPMHYGWGGLYYVFKMSLSILATLLRGKTRKEAQDAV